MKSIGLIAFIFILSGQWLFGSTREEMVLDAIHKVSSSFHKVPKGINRTAVSSITLVSNLGVDTISIEDQLGAAILDSGQFQLIDRKSLKVLIEEQKLSLSGLVDPRSMAEAGKLIGVQGFFFGSLESFPDHVTLNLKLVDVESGAIAYAQKFTGNPKSFIVLGIGFSYAPIILTTTGAQTGESQLPAMGLLLSYKQGFYGFPFGFIGVDLTLTKTFTELAEGDIKRADLKPKLYLSPQNWLNWDLDYVNLILGASISMLLHRNAVEPSAIGIYPLIGLEINLIKFLSLSVEGLWVNRSPMRDNTLVALTDGLSWNTGVRFNWYLY